MRDSNRGERLSEENWLRGSWNAESVGRGWQFAHCIDILKDISTLIPPNHGLFWPGFGRKMA